ncbi:Protein phosphatase 1D [Exaiptasia diaphana]|nr:Protein phosphatase 1D [Exaiptasia diaphana]
MDIVISSDAHQGDREYMEDLTSTIHERVSFAAGNIDQYYIAVYDGHGGSEAAYFARKMLWNTIKKQRGFYSNDPAHVVKAIKEGFLATHRAMWKESDKWPKYKCFWPSTSGTTVSTVIIRGRRMFVAHVGDSGVVLGIDDHVSSIRSHNLTEDHKPESPDEKKRIEALGGAVLARNGTHRVAWKRPVLKQHSGPFLRSTKTELVPFLAVARSLGDFWSYEALHDQFWVSPLPDVNVYDINPDVHKFIIVASDGLWGVVRPNKAVRFVQKTIKDVSDPLNADVSHKLVALAMSKWKKRKTRADNTSVIVVFFQEGENQPCNLSDQQKSSVSQTNTDTASVVSVETPRSM